MCNFTDSNLCISSVCLSQKNLDVDCMAVSTEPCTFTYTNSNYGAGSCAGSKSSTSCSDFNELANVK